MEKVNFRSQILERPSIGEYWNICGVPVLSGNVIFTFFRTCWCCSEAYNTGMKKWSSIAQYSCTSIWDFKYTFSDLRIKMGLKLCSFSLPNTKFSYAKGHCPLATPAKGTSPLNPGKHALVSFVPY